MGLVAFKDSRHGLPRHSRLSLRESTRLLVGGHPAARRYLHSPPKTRPFAERKATLGPPDRKSAIQLD